MRTQHLSACCQEKPERFENNFLDEPDEHVVEYCGYTIIVERIASDFTKTHILNLTGRCLAQISTATTMEGAIAAAKMLVAGLLAGGCE